MPSGLAAEAVLEVGAMPQRILRAGVALVRERHDDVVVDLRDGRAVARVARGAGAISVLDHAVGARGEIGQPAEQSRARN